MSYYLTSSAVDERVTYLVDERGKLAERDIVG